MDSPSTVTKTLDPKKLSELHDRLRFAYDPHFRGYHKLMARRVRTILMVSNAYESFSIARATTLDSAIYDTSQGLHLSNVPRMITALSASEGLRLLEREPFDVVLASANLPDMDIAEFATAAKKLRPEAPVVMLVFDGRWFDLAYQGTEPKNVDWIFTWRGHAAVILSIVKLVAALANGYTDTQLASIGTILVIEDSVERYSALLPLLFTTLIKKTLSFMPEGINESDRLMRTRVRPKVLLARTFAEADALFEKYESTLLGIVSDLRTFHDDRIAPEAGPRFLCKVAARAPGLPVFVQSAEPQGAEIARSIGARYLDKSSSRMPIELEEFVLEDVGFGSFVFRDGQGHACRKVSSLWEMEVALAEVPDESLLFHSERNELSRWFRARGESTLAGLVRPLQVRDFSDVAELRSYLRSAIAIARVEKHRGVVAEFRGHFFDPNYPFLVAGKGSLGGKGRGLAFMFHTLSRDMKGDEFPGIHVRLPKTLVVATGEFDAFMRASGFEPAALDGLADEAIAQRFQEAPLSESLQEDLARYLERVVCPLAVRSSSILEDSHYQPCAGLYSTYLLPNNHPDLKVRVDQLCRAIKLIYASVFFEQARRYHQSTGRNAADEKMAVVIQELIGQRHGDRYYPTLSGVAQSHNYYPVFDMRPEDGAATLALGLGKHVVEGFDALRFSPKYPRVLPQFSSIGATLKASQRDFFALDLSQSATDLGQGTETTLVRLQLTDAEKDGQLQHVGSVVSVEDDRIYDGVRRKGPRVVTFSRLLHSPDSSFCALLRHLLEVGKRNLGCAHEIEFAANLDDSDDIDFAFLQIRPFVASREPSETGVQELEPDQILCRCQRAMGNGRVEGVRTLVYVDPERFDRATSKETARLVGRINTRMASERRSYALIGPGRWGTLDPWLGIPVSWYDISHARLIIEVPARDLIIDPSQGTHFFHNLVSSGVGYFSLPETSNADNFVRWDRLRSLPGEQIADGVRMVELTSPLVILVDGTKQRGVMALGE